MGWVQSRRNFLRFRRQMASRGVPLFVGELAFDDENWLTKPDDNVLHLRTSRDQILWYKENLLNLVERIVPAEFEAIAWIDSDVWFERSDWFEATESALERFPVVQLADTIVKTDFDGRTASAQRTAAFSGCIAEGGNHPGMAWAARRTLWSEAGGLYQHAVIGGGDTAAAGAWLPDAADLSWTYYADLPVGIIRLREWKERQGDCGYLSGTIWHEWHGKDDNRQYAQRAQLRRGLLIERDLMQRRDGLLQWSTDAPADLRRALCRYFEERQEDDWGRLPSFRP